ncbi:hypothetical protein F0562_021877 [Nyssa sinensis]|uniref:Transposase MuDR plant domain-containing protein n=1 Tax=Nyssa sinensis TaxID=561372 RepID=A0A5J5BMR0_9ASTE|nr:hypothetical protein F0562_021877 [Nyssa sinensis]
MKEELPRFASSLKSFHDLSIAIFENCRDYYSIVFCLLKRKFNGMGGVGKLFHVILYMLVRLSQLVVRAVKDEINFSDSDDIYGLTSEDEAFVPSVGENLRKSTCNTAASLSVNVEVHGGDDFSDFESNDDAEYSPSSDDSSTNEGEGEGEGEGKSTSRVFEYNLYGEEYHAREGDKIVLKSGQLFKNVDKFREVLRDYTIQQGCSIIKEKNEKARVTAHCADSSCMWRIRVCLDSD